MQVDWTGLIISLVPPVAPKCSEPRIARSQIRGYITKAVTGSLSGYSHTPVGARPLPEALAPGVRNADASEIVPKSSGGHSCTNSPAIPTCVSEPVSPDDFSGLRVLRAFGFCRRGGAVRHCAAHCHQPINLLPQPPRHLLLAPVPIDPPTRGAPQRSDGVPAVAANA